MDQPIIPPRTPVSPQDMPTKIRYISTFSPLITSTKSRPETTIPITTPKRPTRPPSTLSTRANIRRLLTNSFNYKATSQAHTRMNIH